MLTRKIVAQDCGATNPSSRPSTQPVVSNVAASPGSATAVRGTRETPQPAFEQLLSPKQLGDVLGISPSTLQAWRAAGIGPEFRKLSRRTVRYPLRAVQAWIDAGAALCPNGVEA